MLLQYRKFVILFDGFDEVAKRVNYDVKFSVFNQICKYCTGEWKQITDSYNRAKKTRINTRWQDRSIYPERRLSGQIFINITGIKWKCK